MIIPGFIGKNIPKSFKAQLINKIKSGAVAIYISDANRFTELFPQKGGRKVPACVFAGLPVKPEVTEFKVGKGKVFFVPFRLYLNNRIWSQQRAFVPVIVDGQGILGVGGVGANLDRVVQCGTEIYIEEIEGKKGR